jgi:hypothetical protein
MTNLIRHPLDEPGQLEVAVPSQTLVSVLPLGSIIAKFPENILRLEGYRSRDKFPFHLDKILLV